jgi:hypothetical protein
MVYDVKLMWQLKLMKSSQTISCIRSLCETDISRAILVLIIGDMMMMMMRRRRRRRRRTEMALETSV